MDRELNSAAERYASILADSARGLIDLADPDRRSPSYGCFSYMFWRSKSLDYPSARFQEAAYALALLYRQEYPSNRLRGNARAGELARAGLKFWTSIQHADGSFDEWYRREHGFAATAFSSFALGRAYRLLEDELSAEEKERALLSFRRAAAWLACRDDLAKINHEAVAAAALFCLAEILGNGGFRAAAEAKVAKVLDRQTAEGWFPELGGLDTGYSFLTLEYLSLCWLYRRDERLQAALAKALDFLSFFVHPDLTTGREYNLCGNSYVSLLGAAVLAEFSPAARRLFSEGIGRANVLRQLAQDDLSRCYHLYIGLLAYDQFRVAGERFSVEAARLPYEGPSFRRSFPLARMEVARTKSYYAIVSGNNGGLIKAFPSPQDGREGDSGCHDRGYAIVASRGPTLHSGRWGAGGDLRDDGRGGLKASAPFRPLGYFFPSAWARFLLAAASSLPLGHRAVKKVSDFIRGRKKASLQLLAVPGRACRSRLTRTIVFGENDIRVEDAIRFGEPLPAAWLEADVEITGKGDVARPSLLGPGGRPPRASGSPLSVRKTIACRLEGVAYHHEIISDS